MATVDSKVRILPQTVYGSSLAGLNRFVINLRSTVKDFTEFEQRAAYFDGDIVLAAKKGVNVLKRGSQVRSLS